MWHKLKYVCSCVLHLQIICKNSIKINRWIELELECILQCYLIVIFVQLLHCQKKFRSEILGKCRWQVLQLWARYTRSTVSKFSSHAKHIRPSYPWWIRWGQFVYAYLALNDSAISWVNFLVQSYPISDADDKTLKFVGFFKWVTFGWSFKSHWWRSHCIFFALSLNIFVCMLTNAQVLNSGIQFEYVLYHWLHTALSMLTDAR